MNDPPKLAKVLQTLERVQTEFNRSQTGGKRVSLADVIVLGGCAAVEKAAKDAGYNVQVPFKPGRTDASQEQTDVESFAVLEPTFDGFRNYLKAGEPLSPETLLVERAYMLNLTAPGDDGPGRRHARPERELRGIEARRLHQPTWDVDQRLLRQPPRHEHRLEAIRFGSRTSTRVEIARPARSSGRALRVDLVFGSNSQLRALAEVYACDDAKEKFVRDFVAAWDKVMNLDRFDVA